MAFALGGRCRWSFAWSTRGTHAGIGAKTSHHATVLGELVVAFGSLQDLRDAGKARIAHDPPERLGAERAFADELVPVPARVKRRLRVVEVKHSQVVEPDRVVPPTPYGLVISLQIIPGRIEVAGVGAEADAPPHAPTDRFAERRQLLER